MSDALTQLRSETERAFAHLGKRLVHGEGRENARVMLIGEAPGTQEEAQGRPFVGKAGKNLDAFLSETGIDRAALYVTNTVKFRPSKLSAAGNLVNRPPASAEIEAFKPYLLREIELIRPEFIVTLGNVPLRALMGKSASIGECHGQSLSAASNLPRAALFPLYHPASVIYNPSLMQIWREDIAKLAILLKKQ